MIHIIFGAPGCGKSCKLVHFAKQFFVDEGRSILSNARSLIAKVDYDVNFNYPTQPPIYSDFPMHFQSGYRKTFQPYFINGYYLGLPNDTHPVMSVFPGSKIFLSEVQRYYNSRKFNTMPDFVSRFYEMHRHYCLDIYMDIQRPMLIDVNIRELCEHFIEIVDLKHDYDKLGRIVKTTWLCHEWNCWRNVEDYLKTGVNNYDKVKYVNNGNIFNNYDSFTYFDKFLPKKGSRFSDVGEDDADLRQSDFYSFNMPGTFRGDKNGRI